jgi:hypothetical protein
MLLVPATKVALTLIIILSVLVACSGSNGSSSSASRDDSSNQGVEDGVVEEQSIASYRATGSALGDREVLMLLLSSLGDE